ncbi:MAG: nitrate/nitrite transporter NrtS [Candidatus Methylomirabilis oxyfera]|nr:nitrate/nitrite transporter NrtS [Candidatus Methylomirabilis oxyfera]
MPRRILQYCKHPGIVRSAVKTALVVGTILAFINHFDHLLSLRLNVTEFVKIAVTYLVPFLVATYAAARHAQSLEESEEADQETEESGAGKEER